MEERCVFFLLVWFERIAIIRINCVCRLSVCVCVVIVFTRRVIRMHCVCKRTTRTQHDTHYYSSYRPSGRASFGGIFIQAFRYKWIEIVVFLLVICGTKFWQALVNMKEKNLSMVDIVDIRDIRKIRRFCFAFTHDSMNKLYCEMGWVWFVWETVLSQVLDLDFFCFLQIVNSLFSWYNTMCSI